MRKRSIWTSLSCRGWVTFHRNVIGDLYKGNLYNRLIWTIRILNCFLFLIPIKGIQNLYNLTKTKDIVLVKWWQCSNLLLVHRMDAQPIFLIFQTFDCEFSWFAGKKILIDKCMKNWKKKWASTSPATSFICGEYNLLPSMVKVRFIRCAKSIF